MEQALSCDQVTAEVVTAMQGAGIEAIVLKGPSIARWLYYPDGSRGYTDSDILVRWHDVETAYIRHDGAGGSLVDLHHNLPRLPVPDEALWREFTADLAERLGIVGIFGAALRHEAIGAGIADQLGVPGREIAGPRSGYRSLRAARRRSHSSGQYPRCGRRHARFAGEMSCHRSWLSASRPRTDKR